MAEELEKKWTLEEFLATKEKIRKDSIRLSFEEKIKRVIEMQKIERDLKKDKDKIIYVWNL